MIDNNELRLGNTVKYNEEFCFVDAIHTNTFAVVHNTQSYLLTPDCVEPILLKEDVLLKCGFKKDKLGHFNLSWSLGMDKTKTIQFELGDDYIFCSFWIGIGNDKTFLVCKYLHQLQNLYYSLKNEELDINL